MGEVMAKDALSLLENDHRTVEKLFDRYRQAGDPTQKRLVAEDIIKELSVHASIEEEILYPVVAEVLPDGERLAQEARDEHRTVKELLSELEDLDPAGARFDERVRSLIDDVTHHVAEEEGQMFPRLRQALPKKRLKVMGEALGVARLVAPTRPHPKLPDTPPANVVVGAAVAVVDRARDVARDVRRTATGAATKPKRTTAKASARKKPSVKRSAARKKAPATKRTTAKKTTAKRRTAKKAPAKRTTAKKRTAARKATPRRAA
jgi:hemerythrin superfamily protein